MEFTKTTRTNKWVQQNCRVKRSIYNKGGRLKLQQNCFDQDIKIHDKLYLKVHIFGNNKDKHNTWDSGILLCNVIKASNCTTLTISQALLSVLMPLNNSMKCYYYEYFREEKIKESKIK